ncbi:hypothetical protein M422DRAFT_251749 [Sphaerobolus stellatus SS14]|nr:hypothetical protein M422DRAFT_251749 [Sphaerobolus stellatus SS14]
MDQFNNFIVQTMHECSIVGHILLVIDALDECVGESRKQFLKLLAGLKLPDNFRVFITSRPDKDIRTAFSQVHIIQLQAECYQKDIEGDISHFVLHKLLVDSPSPHDIQRADCDRIVKNSEGLFQWASVACEFIQEAVEGAQSPITALNEVSAFGSGLYNLYETVLHNRFKNIKKHAFNQEFKTVLGFVLSVYRPLPMTALTILWEHAFEVKGANALERILAHMGSLFNGIGNPDMVISPIHTSVRDFFTSTASSKESPSTLPAGDFHLNTNEYHFTLSIALLKVLNMELYFTIFYIKSSYLWRSKSKDIKTEDVQKMISPQLSYACQFLGDHLNCVEIPVPEDQY